MLLRTVVNVSVGRRNCQSPALMLLIPFKLRFYILKYQKIGFDLVFIWRFYKGNLPNFLWILQDEDLWKSSFKVLKWKQSWERYKDISNLIMKDFSRILWRYHQHNYERFWQDPTKISSIQLWKFPIFIFLEDFPSYLTLIKNTQSGKAICFPCYPRIAH